MFTDSQQGKFPMIANLKSSHVGGSLKYLSTYIVTAGLAKFQEATF